MALIFAIPVRHPASVPDWGIVKRDLAQTLASIAAQEPGGEWECRIVANRGADLPPLPAGCHVRHVDLPLPVLPDRTRDRQAYFDAIRHDKGLRLYAAVGDVDPRDHVMFVDFDDLVSRRLARLVAAHPEAPGWYFDWGYIFSGRGRLCYLKRRFNHTCGTSHVLRRDLIGPFETPAGEPDMAMIKRHLGSHLFVQKDLVAAGAPLAPLPFPGAFYRIGNPQSTSGTGGLVRALTPPPAFLRHPWGMTRRAMNYRLIDARLREEFTLA